MALLPLLWGELEVLDVIFSGADVLFEVGVGDRSNFTFGRRTGPPERFDFADLLLAEELHPLESLHTMQSLIAYEYRRWRVLR